MESGQMGWRKVGLIGREKPNGSLTLVSRQVRRMDLAPKLLPIGSTKKSPMASSMGGYKRDPNAQNVLSHLNFAKLTTLLFNIRTLLQLTTLELFCN